MIVGPRHDLPEYFEPPVFAALCSPDLATAAERLARLKPLIGPVALGVRDGADALEITYRWKDASIRQPAYMHPKSEVSDTDQEPIEAFITEAMIVVGRPGPARQVIVEAHGTSDAQPRSLTPSMATPQVRGWAPRGC